MKKLYTILLAVTLALLLSVGIWSLVGNGETVSAVDGKTLEEKPEFSFAALFDGTYLPALERSYSDHFPMRDTLLTAGKTLNRFYYYSGSDEDAVLILGGSTGAEQGGERLDAALTGPVTEPEQPESPDKTPEEAPDDVTPEPDRKSTRLNSSH